MKKLRTTKYSGILKIKENVRNDNEEEDHGI